MKFFKKVAINIHSHVEALADRFENKEALSTAYIHEYERVVAKAKVKTAQVDSEVTRLEKEAAQLREQSELWAERARRVHLTDESKALACVARMTQSQAGYRQVQTDLEEAGKLKKKMAQDVDHILKKLETLKRKHQNLAGRQVCAEAVNTLQNANGGIQYDIDNLFTRWETDVVAQELHAQSPEVASDCLAEEFDSAEQKQALRMALEQIIATPCSTEEKKQ
jgi:phage shock protein A